MEDNIPERPYRSLLLDSQTYKWSLWDVVFHENDSFLLYILYFKKCKSRFKNIHAKQYPMM